MGLCKTYTISPTSHQVLFVTDQVGNIAHCPYEPTWGPEMMLHNGQHGMSKGEIHGNQHLIPREKKHKFHQKMVITCCKISIIMLDGFNQL